MEMEKIKKIEMEKTKEEYQKLIKLEFFTEKELKLLTTINGLSIKTLNDAIRAKFGSLANNVKFVLSRYSLND